MRKTLLSAMAAAGLVVSLTALATGCKQEVAASQRATASAEPVKAAASTSKVAKVVFVGKQNACDCTRKRIDDSWAALQQALGTPAALPVQQLQVDTDELEVEAFKQQKAIMVLPAIYFVDGQATVLEMLQGEVTAQQIRNALK